MQNLLFALAGALGVFLALWGLAALSRRRAQNFGTMKRCRANWLVRAIYHGTMLAFALLGGVGAYYCLVEWGSYGAKDTLSLLVFCLLLFFGGTWLFCRKTAFLLFDEQRVIFHWPWGQCQEIKWSEFMPAEPGVQIVWPSMHDALEAHLFGGKKFRLSKFFDGYREFWEMAQRKGVIQPFQAGKKFR